jgi:hypothetical protein
VHFVEGDGARLVRELAPVDLTARSSSSTPFVHGDWGRGTVGDATRWLAHEYLHHELDVDERATRRKDQL